MVKMENFIYVFLTKISLKNQGLWDLTDWKLVIGLSMFMSWEIYDKYVIVVFQYGFLRVYIPSSEIVESYGSFIPSFFVKESP